MASHHSKIPAIPLVAAETCWLSQILSKSMGDILYQEKVLASAHIQSIKRLFMSDSDASVSLFNKVCSYDGRPNHPSTWTNSAPRVKSGLRSTPTLCPCKSVPGLF